MTAPRSLGRLIGALASASLFALAACQQVLGLDQPTVAIDAISRICECLPLTQQGPTFAGNDAGACERALADQPDELLLAVAENECTDCDNVTPCYALLTEARDAGDACGTSADCASWVCCQGVLSVELTLSQDGVDPKLVSTPTEAACCTACSPCADALAALNTETDVVACAESQAPLYDLLKCLGEDHEGCGCLTQNGVTPECLSCLANHNDAPKRCEAYFLTCSADLGRPVPVRQ